MAPNYSLVKNGIVVVLALSALILTGCLGFFESQENPLLKHLPDDSLKGVLLLNINEKGMEEVRDIVGLGLTSLFGGSALRQIKSVEGAGGMYEDNSSIFVFVLQTKNSLEEFVEEYEEGGILSSLGGKTTNEKKEVNGRTVYAIYNSYDRKKDSPSCAWVEGGGIAIMTTSSSFNQPKRSCLRVLEKTYSTEKASKLLEKTSDWMKKIPSAGEEIGSIKVQVDTGGGAVKAFRDEDATYLLILGESAKDIPAFGSFLGESENRNLCGGSYGDNASVVEKDGKKACKRQSNQLLILQRNGENGVTAAGIAYIKGGKSSREKASGILENAVFGIDLSAKDEEWRDDMDVTLNVRVKEPRSASPTPYVEYDYRAPQGEPLEGAKAELYISETDESESGGLLTGYLRSYKLGTLRETKYSDAQGNVKFERVPLQGAQIVLSKEGYEPESAYGGNNNYTVSVSSYRYTKTYYFQKIVPRNVTVNVVAKPSLYDYTSPTIPLEGAKVELFDRYIGSYDKNAVPIATAYTESSGYVIFENVEARSGSVRVSKEGYKSLSGSETISTSFYADNYGYPVTVTLVGGTTESPRTSATPTPLPAYNYSANAQYVKVDHSDDFRLKKFEIEAWIKPSLDTNLLPNAFTQTIVAKENYWALRFAGGGSYSLQNMAEGAYVPITGIWDVVYTSWPADTSEGTKRGKWYRLLFSYDGNEKIQVNDEEKVLASSYHQSSAPIYPSNKSDLYIGRESEEGMYQQFIGVIDEVKIWDLSNGRKLVAHYSFEEAGGSSVKDVSGNGHDGILVGAKRVAGKQGQGLEFTR